MLMKIFIVSPIPYSLKADINDLIPATVEPMGTKHVMKVKKST